MLDFKQCEAIADEKALECGAEIDKAYTLGDAYVFESKPEYMGTFPLVVTKEGEKSGLWAYLNSHDLTMDDMQEIQA